MIFKKPKWKAKMSTGDKIKALRKEKNGPRTI
jgi:hypothetical protein